MRIAIFSDIHGNTPGLRAVLGAIQRSGGADRIIAAGDLMGAGPGTEEIIDLLMESGAQIVRGNWEEIILMPQQIIPQIVPPRYRDFAFRSADWLGERLSQPYLDLVADFPLSIRLEPEAGHAILVCHAAPGNPWSRTCASEVSRETLQAVYGGVAAEVVVYGHFHGHHTLWLDEKLLINVAHVGLRKDGLSAYTLLSYTTHWQVQQQLVPYDTAEEARLIARYKPPET